MKKSTFLRSLILCGLSMCLCISMLAGSTFAWFTDEVKSGNNTIMAGNLDVELYNGNTQITGAASDPKFFDDVALWEPGAMAWDTFTVKNAGNLALKYQLEFNVSDPAVGVSLAKALKIAVADAEPTATRPDPSAYEWQPFETFVLEGKLDLVNASEETYTLIVWWEPSDNDNDFNMNNGATEIASVDFSLKLVATQLDAEDDAFGPDYDEDAVWADTYAANAAELADALANAKDGDVIALTGDIDFANTKARSAANFALTVAKGKNVTINLNGYDISSVTANDSGNQGIFCVQGNLTVVGEGTISVTHTGANMAWNNLSAVFSVEGGTLTLGEGVSAVHNGGTDMAYVVDVNTTLGETVLNVNGAILTSTYVGVRVFNNHKTAKGIVNYNSGIISGESRDVWTQIMSAPAENAVVNTTIPYTTNDAGDRYFFEGAAVSNNAGISNALANGEKDITLVEGEYTLPTLSGKEGVTIVGAANGSTVIGGENATTGFAWSNFGKDTTIKNVTFAGSSNGVRWSYAQGGTSTFENCTFAGDSTYGFHMDSSNGATLIFNNCTFIGFNAFAGDLVKVVFNNCTFLHNGNYGHTNIWSTAEFNNCTFGDKASVGTRGDNAHIFFNGVEESYKHEYIGSVESLLAFAEAVNSGEDYYQNSAIVLVADIDLENAEWTPIGSATADHGFMGNFDGNGYAIKNLSITNIAIDTDGYAYAGFFGVTEGAKGAENVIKNLKIENVTIKTTGKIVAAAIAYPYYTTLENITVCGDIAIEGGDYTAGVLAYTRYCTTASNISICGNDGSYITGAITVGGVISDIQMNGGLTAKYSNFSIANVTVTGEKCVGGISGIICNQSLNGASVKNVTLVCSDAHAGIVAGSWSGEYSITNKTYANVTGADSIVGAEY